MSAVALSTYLPTDMDSAILARLNYDLLLLVSRCLSYSSLPSHGPSFLLISLVAESLLWIGRHFRLSRAFSCESAGVWASGTLCRINFDPIANSDSHPRGKFDSYDAAWRMSFWNFYENNTACDTVFSCRLISSCVFQLRLKYGEKKKKMVVHERPYAKKEYRQTTCESTHQRVDVCQLLANCRGSGGSSP